MNIVLVCFHKLYEYKYKGIYTPILGGVDNKPNLVLDKEVLKDNTNENISKKNPYYLELTTICF